MKSLEELRAAERERAGTVVRVAAVDMSFGDVFTLTLKVVASLVVIGAPIGVVVALIA